MWIRLWSNAINASSQRYEVFPRLQLQTFVKERKTLTQDVKTRWNSTYMMLKKICDLAEDHQMTESQSSLISKVGNFESGMGSSRFHSCSTQKVALDVLHMPLREGKKYLIQARCDFSGKLEARALRNPDSESVAKFFYEEIICRHGCVGRIIVDGGPENKGWVSVLAEKYKLKKVFVSGYHAQPNGIVERGHQPVVDASAKMTEGGSSNCDLINARRHQWKKCEQ